jgi:hypothetical protein
VIIGRYVQSDFEANKILAAAFAFNEGDKIRRTVARHPHPRDYDLMVMDGGSTDGSVLSLANTWDADSLERNEPGHPR